MAAFIVKNLTWGSGSELTIRVYKICEGHKDFVSSSAILGGIKFEEKPLAVGMNF